MKVLSIKPVFYNGKPIYNLHGNVWEWVQDWHGNKLFGGTDPQGPTSGPGRVVRGGGWNYKAWFLRSAHRNSLTPGNRYYGLGFRLLRTPKR